MEALTDEPPLDDSGRWEVLHEAQFGGAARGNSAGAAAAGSSGAGAVRHERPGAIPLPNIGESAPQPADFFAEYGNLELLLDGQYMNRVVELAHKMPDALSFIWATHYTFDDMDLTEAYCAAAQRGVEVNVVLDKGQATGSSSKNQGARMRACVEKGVHLRIGQPCQGRHTVHQKSYVFQVESDRIALFGSGNATGYSRDRCFEVGGATRDPEVCRQLYERITGLWSAGLEVTPEMCEASSASYSQRNRSASSSVTR